MIRHKMEENLIRPLQERTDAKLRYAGVHLGELQSYGPLGGDDFDRAHQESFLFHLLGARDSLLSEMNFYFSADLAPDGITLGKLHQKLKMKGMTSSELKYLYELEQDENSWFHIAKSMRDHSMHVQGVKRTFHMGGPDHHKVKLKYPTTGELSDHHVLDEFSEWLQQMEKLVSTLRESAGKSAII